MSGVRTVSVTQEDAGMRLDRWFRRHYPDLGHGRLEKLLRTGQVRVDGGRVKAGTRLETGQKVRVPPLPAPLARTEPATSARPADAAYLRTLVLHEDEYVLVLNKPAGLAVQGGSRTTRHLDAMLAALKGRGGTPRLVHRLDRDTSGVLVVARNRPAAIALTAAFKARETAKLYWGLTVGVPKPRAGTVDLALAKKGGTARERVAPAPAGAGGQRAFTRYALLAEAARKIAWLALWPVTGRTHQLRVHCAELGTPLLGDRKYGGAIAQPGGFAKQLHLHARRLVVAHPADGILDVEAPLPPHMEEAFQLLGFDAAAAENPFEREAAWPKVRRG